ncbi:hypothetical protein GM31_18810 [Trabulsiella odontotermitis]|uniref:Uncharacterized protein n=1 Tax=Trabulsiella odontotermitis TaxID=379893 RepID=A0A0L0GY07_9ENTR|nr:hypothetical protein GM31_18810 [Trabulsiella odontotermitis]
MTELKNCQTCGQQPEFYWRDYTSGSCFGELKCIDRECIAQRCRVSVSYGAGSQKRATNRLIEQWNELMAKENQHG